MTTTNYIQVIADYLYNYRTEKGMERKEMAELLGVSYRSFCNYENALQSPTLKNILDICNKLEISLSDLLGINKLYS